MVYRLRSMSEPLHLERHLAVAVPRTALPRGYRLRPYRPGDEAAWTTLLRRAERLHPIGPESFLKAFPGDDRLRADRIAFAVDGRGETAGTVGAWFTREGPRGHWGMVHWLAVDPDHRGRGLAKALLAWCLKRLRRWHRMVYLGTSSSRTAALKLYLDFGFAPVLFSEADKRAWHGVARRLGHDALHLLPSIQAPAGRFTRPTRR